MDRKQALALSCLLVVVRIPAVGAETPPTPADAAWVVSLQGAAPDPNKPLDLHLAVRGGKIVAAIATARTYNGAIHDVDADALKLDGRRLTGEAAVTVNPDNYTPADGKPVACRFKLDCAADANGPAGTYTGTVAGRPRGGAVTGRLAKHYDPAAPHSRLRLRFYSALVRLFVARGPNWKYALDMNAGLAVRDGRIGNGRFETIVPDYRRYSATIEKHDLKIDGCRLGGTMTVRVDYGGQGSARDSAPNGDTYVYTLHGTVIGDAVGGTFDASYGDQKAAGYRFAGAVDRSPPPVPAACIATLRMLDAMGDGAPVLLTLSLAGDGPIHGYAFAPGYNHEVHTVDASGLKLDGKAIRGQVKVSISPDCYRPPEHFTMAYKLDAAIDDEDVSGTFTGSDSKKSVKGAISGELRAKKPPTKPWSLKTLARCELDFGYSLVTGPMPKSEWGKSQPNHLKVTFDVRDGKVSTVQAANADKADLLKAKVTDSALDIQGDRLTGRVRFEQTGDAVSKGTYEYAFEAIVDGNGCLGYWRGSLDGKPIYVKSAKMGGKLQ
jgi:hypothetical protein